MRESAERAADALAELALREPRVGARRRRDLALHVLEAPHKEVSAAVVSRQVRHLDARAAESATLGRHQRVQLLLGINAARVLLLGPEGSLE